MRRSWLPSIVCAFLATLLLPHHGNAQTSLPPDSATTARAGAAGIYLVHWVQKENSSEQSIYFKNTAPFPLQVTDWEVYACQNLGGKDCGLRTTGPLLAPGQTVKLITVRQRDRHAAFAYQYRFHVMWGPGVASDTTAAPPPQ
jgi:hypothetical protein